MKDKEQNLNIRHTKDYLHYHFGKKNSYKNFDKNEQDRHKFWCNFDDMFDDGVYDDNYNS